MSTYYYGFKFVLHKNKGRTSEKFVRSDQGRIDVKSTPKGKVLIRCSGKAIYGRFQRQGVIRWRVRWMRLKGGEPVTGAELRVVLTSNPQIDTEGIEVRLRSGESLLEVK